MMQNQHQQQMEYAHLQAYLQRCHLGQQQQVYHQQQPMAVSKPRKEAMIFPPYAHTQLVYWRPATTSAPPQPLHQHPHQLYPRQLHGASYHTTMDSKASTLEHSNLNQPLYNHGGMHAQGPPLGAGLTRVHHPHPEPFLPPSHFFDDNFNAHRPEEAALYNPHHGQQQQQQQYQNAVTMSDYLHHPVPKSHTTQTSAEALARHVTMSPYLPPLQAAQTHVDTSYYEPIDPEDFKSVSYSLFDDDDDEADSPTSIDSHGPFTPRATDYSSSYGTSFGSSFSSGLPELVSSFSSQDSAMFMVKPSSQILGSDNAGAFDGYGRVAAIDHHHGCNTSLLDGGLARLDRHRGSDEQSNIGMRTTASMRDIHGYPFSVALSQTTPQPRRGATNATVTVIREDSFSQEDAETDRANEERRHRDQYLLDMRDKGWSYKEIKRRGRFHEAESTLRGRVRVLTKDKSERVRKPEWTDRDVNLLRNAVAHYQRRLKAGKCQSSRNGKLPWKRVSTRMRTKGASYLFAPATCAKKWEEVVEEDEEDDE